MPVAALLLAATACPGAPVPAATRDAYSFPRFSGYVVDEAGVMDASQRLRLARKLGRVQRRTGHQVVVVTVKSLGGHPVEAYTTALGNRWGVGRRGINDGVVVLVAPHERRVRISVGCGLTRMLTDEEAGNIVQRRMLPAFRAARMAQGIIAGVDGVVHDIAPGETVL